MSRAQRFLDHLDAVSGGREPRFIPIESTKPGVANVTVVVYDHVPEPGMTTGITYGLSIVDHPRWTRSRPELSLTVATMDDAWMYVLGEIAERLRGDCPFVYGSTVDVGGSVDPETGLSSFVVFAPSVLNRADYERVELGLNDLVSIVGIYPIHESERRFIIDHGLEEFWRLDWDMYDVSRGPVV
jgi:Suppressor of fused protein (SUFU)